MQLFCAKDNDDLNDHKFQTMILFLPQCGVLYCAIQDCHQKTGLLNSLVSIDMSLLKLPREKNPGTLCWSIHLAKGSSGTTGDH
jgi:hypothetical protein